MALPINIRELLNGQVIEWERLEFKRDWNPVPVLRTLCAFANDINNWGGGYIIIGVEEIEGRPVLPPEGVAAERMDSIQKELTNLCQRLQPNYLPIAQPYVVHDKHILVIWAPAGDMRPYTAPDGLKKGAQRFSYIRSAASTIKAKGENLRRLQELTARIPFDDRVQQQATLKDLSLGLIRDFLNEIDSELFDQSATMPFADLCRQMAIAKGPDEQLRPVNAGLMFFCEQPERFFSRTWIEVVIREDEAGKRFSEKYFKGPLHIQLRNALSYIRNNIIEERVQKVSGRAEADRYFNYPYDAVEEALAKLCTTKATSWASQ
ncbi:MAG: putative DNA binding domain-containing protein [Mameliella sp.]|nr:putative DNA binding domain-containing protein [Phaeodactylibacter sp.]